MLAWLSIQMVITSSNSFCNVEKCLTCSYRSAEICINCEYGYIRSQSGCIQSAQKDYQAIENCLKYSSQGLCSNCETGFSLSSNACEPDCPEGCICFDPGNCKNSNELISSKYIQSRTRKLACENCADCDSSDLCNSCNDRYYLGSDQICYACTDNCGICYSSECYRCDDGYELDSSYNCAISCSDDCSSCESADVCNECDEGYYLSDNYCYDCGTYCTSCNSDGTCSACSSGYELINEECVLVCSENCIDCYSYESCYTCDEGYELDSSNQCIISCSDNCYICESLDVCNECDTGYYLSDNACYYCGSECEYCNSDGTCASCFSGYELENGKCIMACTDKCYYCYSYDDCYECDDGYYESYGSCYSCISHCKKCTYSYRCSQCESGYSYVNRKCISDAEKANKIIVIAAPIGSVVVFIILIIVLVCLIKRHARKIRERNRIKFAKTEPVNMNSAGVVHSLNNMDKGSSYQNYPATFAANAPGSVIQPQNIHLPPPNVAYEQTQGFNIGNTNLLRIDPTNFIMVVPLVYLDPTNRYIGQDTCVICQGLFRPDVDTRTLPCMHAFHGKCIYDLIISPTGKCCPICKRQYS